MSEQQDFATHIVDLIADGSLYLKADAESREVFVTEGGREYQLSYYLAADDFFEDDVACLARISHHPSTAALRNPARHKKKRS
jgi:TfoX/Sxy family transcriptional regulator of competence genes